MNETDDLQGMLLAQAQAPDWTIQLAAGQWVVSPLLWAYALGAGLCLLLLWRLTRAWRSPWRAAALRAGAAALLCTPAVLACEAIAVMPLPVLLLRALQNPDAVSCGAPLVALPPNLMSFAGLWLALFFALWLLDALRRKAP